MDPEEIENRQFVVSLRGYARDEVEAFRQEVTQEIKILRKQLTRALSDLSHANSELEKAKVQLAETSAHLAEERSHPAPEPPAPGESPQPAPPEDRASMFRMVGQETERILLAAEQAAEQIHDRAVKESAELMTDARLQVQRSIEELDAARRAAEEDFNAIRDSRGMVASQLEDIRRRLEETINRLRVPIDLPGAKPASRFRTPLEVAERAGLKPPVNRLKEAESQAQQRRQLELEAAKELQARQTAHRGEAERRDSAARKAQEARAAAAAVDAERLKAAREAEQLKEAQEAESGAREAERAAKARAERASIAEAERAAEAEAERAAEAEVERVARVAADRAAKEEAERVAKAEAERAAAERERVEQSRQAKTAKAAKPQEARVTVAPEPAPDLSSQPPPAAGTYDASQAEAPAGEGGSSLDELLEEIRRKREGDRRPAEAGAEDEEPARVAVAAELSRRSEVLGDLPAQTARRLKRLLQEDHNDLLDRVRTQRGKGSLDDNLAPFNEQLGRFVSGLHEALNRAFSEGRKAAGATGAVDASAALSRLVTRQVLNPLRSEVSKAVEAGLEAEESPSALSERANDVFRVWKGVRTQLLGEGIAYAAYHQGLLDALSSKASAQKVWVLAEDEHECPNDICRRNAAAGAVALKAPFPSGHLAPPAHGGCTCTLKGS